MKVNLSLNDRLTEQTNATLLQMYMMHITPQAKITPFNYLATIKFTK